MFRGRREESEWSRFSKAFTTKEKEERPDESNAGARTAEGADPAPPAEPAASVVLAGSPSARPPLVEPNVALTRPGPNAGHPTYSIDDVDSTIGEHTFVEGTYRSESSVRIRGTAQGEIQSAKAVFIEEKAKVSAKVTAASITVAGEVNGELVCTGRVEIRPTGRVTGTISAGTLVVQDGAFFDGNVRMDQPSGEPSPGSQRQP